MKHGNPRGGYVDGVRGDSLIELGKLLGCTDSALSKYSRSRGQEFDYKGHRVVMDEPNRRSRCADDEGEIEAIDRRRAPVDPLAIALAARRNYDSTGTARHGLLVRLAR